jgi:hypothetical protein
MAYRLRIPWMGWPLSGSFPWRPWAVSGVGPHACNAQITQMTAGGRTREYRMKVAEPEPGRILTESDTDSGAVTTFTVSPQGGALIVQISTAWDGAGGIGGLFERMFAPRVLHAIYADELERLDAYAGTSPNISRDHPVGGRCVRCGAGKDRIFMQ